MNADSLSPILVETLSGKAESPAGALAAAMRERDSAAAPSPTLGEVWPLAGGAPHKQRVRCGDETSLLGELMEREAESLLGRQAKPDGMFPIQIRAFEVPERQPLQVCASPEGRRVGNSLFWFSLASDPAAQVAIGIQHRVTRGQFISALDSPALWELLRVFPASVGDAFFMAPGVVFAADAGCVLLEIAHPTVGRRTVSSWSAAAEDPAQAIRQIRFAERAASRIRKDVSPVDRSRKIPLVNISPDFDIDEVRVIDYFFGRTDGTAPHVLCPVAGPPVVVESSRGSVEVPLFRVCVLPARAGDYHIKGEGPAAKVLRVTPKSVFG